MMEDLVWWAISLLFVLALILGLALLLKKFFMPGTSRGPIFRKAAQRRLEVIESLPLDPKTRLMLIRRDEINHLILVGSTGDQVIETNITPPPASKRLSANDQNYDPAHESRDSTKFYKDDNPADTSDSGGDGGD
jgi:flagellar biogenesis protein FliO